MNIITNTSPWPFKDRDWVVDVSYENEVVTVNIFTMQNALAPVASGNIDNVVFSNISTSAQYGNASISFNMNDIRSQFVDHGAFVMLADKHQDLNNDAISYAGNSVITTQRTSFQDLFKLTNPAKLRFKDLRDLHNKLSYATLITPFADSSDDEVILMVRGPSDANVTMNVSGFSANLGTTVSEGWKTDSGWLTLFPSLKSEALSVGLNTTTEFTIQLVDNAGTAIKRSGVTIFLETTGGVLATNRIVTDENGIATGGIMVTSIPTQFKIKAGFKYFTGVIDIPVTVS